MIATLTAIALSHLFLSLGLALVIICSLIPLPEKLGVRYLRQQQPCLGRKYYFSTTLLIIFTSALLAHRCLSETKLNLSAATDVLSLPTAVPDGPILRCFENREHNI